MFKLSRRSFTLGTARLAATSLLFPQRPLAQGAARDDESVVVGRAGEREIVITRLSQESARAFGR